MPPSAQAASRPNLRARAHMRRAGERGARGERGAGRGGGRVAGGARLPPSRMSLLATVVTSRAPVAPNGWPIESDPPWTLNLSICTSPTLGSPPSFSSYHACESSARRLRPF